MRAVRASGLQRQIEGAAVVRVFATIADEMAGLGITEVELQPGATTGEHSHDSDQIVYLLEGEALFAGEGEELLLAKGDLIYVPAGQRHRHDSIGSSPLRQLSIFVPAGRSSQA